MLLELTAVETGYGASQVLFGVDLAVPDGAVVTLLGRNGMGKTTTLRAAFGVLPLQRGQIRFGGERIDGLATDVIARRGLALVPEGRQVFPNLSVRENLAAFADNRSGSREPWTIERVFALFPQLAQRAAAMGNQLSGGEQQMLAIGRALMTNPRLLVLDEATEGLAPRIARDIWAIIATIRESGIATIIVDKNFAAVSKFSDRSVILVKGRVVFDDTSESLRGQDELHLKYLGV